MSGTTDQGAERVANLRGASSQVNHRKLIEIISAVLIVTLAVLTVVTFIAASHKNSQITELDHHGITVTDTVTGCLGQLGGSGSNAAGYSCQGNFTVGGHTYNENIPGSTLRYKGTKLQIVTVLGDPTLLEPVSMLAAEHTSGKVYILPSVLLVLFVGSLALGTWRIKAPGRTV